MNTTKKKIILARTAPRVKRPAASIGKVRVGVEKFITGSASTPQSETNQTQEVKNKLNGRKCIRIGQWNVRGLNALGKLSILSKELERLEIGICGLSETKWSDEGHFQTTDGHTVLFAGERGREHHGVGIWINKSIARSLLSYNPVNGRIISATFGGKPRDITVIQCYAPTADKPDEEIEQFYRDLGKVLTETPKRNVIVITGDFNARVGADGVEEEISGKFGHGERNDRGQTLIDFCAENKMVITNTLFRLHSRHRYTWQHPNGNTRSQIDYILINRQWKQAINNSRTSLSADCDSDHKLLILTLKMRFKKNNVSKPVLLDMDKLKNNEYRQLYQIEVMNKFQELERINEPRTPDELWKQLKEVTIDTAEKMLRKKGNKCKNWISSETFELIKKKREARGKSTTEYNRLRSEVQKMLRRDKQAELDQLCTELESNAKKGNSRSVFQTVKKLTKQFQPKTTAINNRNGKKLVEPEKVCDRWKEYCEELYDGEVENVQIEVAEKEPPPLKEEIRRAVLQAAVRKAAGPDGIAVELLKYGGEMTLNKLHEICTEVWQSGIWPEEWTHSVFFPIHKKGDILQCNNYRTIALVSHASKVLLKVILERIKTKLETEIAQEQAGFRPKRGTRDQITNLRIILEKAKERNQPLYFCFIDFTKAFDMVQHDQLWMIMLEMGFPPHLVQLMRNLYSQQRAAVRVANLVSTWFKVKKGVRQGCNLSPCLFNILAEHVMRKALQGFRGGFKIGGRIINNLRYADDIVLVATSLKEMQELVKRVEEVAKEFNMLINAAKTKVMTNTMKTMNVMVDGGTLEQVNCFVYLGSNISNDADCTKDVKARLAMGMVVMNKLVKIWKNKSISNNTKIRLMKSLTWSVATYGCESWTLKKEEERRIQAFENKCIRKLLRIPWTKMMTNDQVYKMAGTRRDLLGHIRGRKLRYFGHTLRNVQETVESSVMTGLVEGDRGKGRPRICWFDNIKVWTGLSGSKLFQAVRDRRAWSALAHSCSQPSRSDEGV